MLDQPLFDESELLGRIAVLEEILLKTTIAEKTALTIEEAAEYMGMSVSKLYKLTRIDAIPYFKPTGRKIYFNTEALDHFLLYTNRVSSLAELEEEFKNRKVA